MLVNPKGYTAENPCGASLNPLNTCDAANYLQWRAIAVALRHDVQRQANKFGEDAGAMSAWLQEWGEPEGSLIEKAEARLELQLRPDPPEGSNLDLLFTPEPDWTDADWIGFNAFSDFEGITRRLGEYCTQGELMGVAAGIEWGSVVTAARGRKETGILDDVLDDVLPSTNGIAAIILGSVVVIAGVVLWRRG